MKHNFLLFILVLVHAIPQAVPATEDGCGEKTLNANSKYQTIAPTPAAKNCQYTISVQTGNVQLTLKSINLPSQCTADYVAIYPDTPANDGSNAVLGPTCELPAVVTYVSTATKFVVVYKKTSEDATHTGFTADFITATGCGEETLRANDKEQYLDPANLAKACTYKITSPDASIIRLTLTSIALPSTCTDSYVAIYNDEKDKNNPILGETCKTQLPQVKTYRSDGPHMDVIYKLANPTKDHTGFTATFMAENACGELTMNATEEVQTIDPANSATSCTYKITGQPGNVIKLTITSIALPDKPCATGYLALFNDISDKTKPILDKVCTTTPPQPNTYTSKSNLMYVEYKLDAPSSTHTGFVATFEAAPDPCGSTTLIATTEEKTLDTPVAANDCTYLITGEDGKLVELTFTEINLPADCANDYVALYNSADGTSEITGKKCGETLPDPVTYTSAGKTMAVVYKKASAVATHIGFKATYKSVNSTRRTTNSVTLLFICMAIFSFLTKHP